MWTSPKSSRMLLWALFCCIALTLVAPCVATSSPQTSPPTSGGGSGVNTTSSGVGSGVNTTPSGGGSEVNMTSSGGRSGVNTSTSGVGSVGSTSTSGVGSVGSTASSGVGSVGSTSTSGVGSVGSTASSGVGSVGSTSTSGVGSVGSTTPSGVGSGVNTSTSGVGSVGSTSTSGVGSVGSTASSGVGSVGSTSTSGVGSVGSTASSGVGSVGSTSTSGVGSVGSTTPSGVGSVGNTTPSGVGSGVNTTPSGGGSGVNTTSSGGRSGVNTSTSGVGSVGSTATSGVGSVGSTASSGVGSVGSTSTSGVGSVGSTSTSGVGSVGSTSTSGVGSVGSTATSGAGSVGSTATSGAGSVGSTATSGAGSVGSTATSGAGSVGSTATSGAGSVGSTATSGAGSVGSTATSGAGSVGSTATVGENTTLSTSQAERKTTTEANNNAKKKTIGELTVELSFTIKFNGNFTKDLFNDSTEEFKNLSSTYEHVLSVVFNSTEGFRSVTITRFWLGSIGVDYTLTYAADTNSTALKQELTNRIPSELKNLTDVDGQYIDITFEQEVTRAVQELTKVSEDPCSIENVCPEKCSVVDGGTTIQCIDPCHAHCVSPGVCFLDSVGEAKCRCPVNDHFVYGGDRCEQKAEKLDLSSNTIIAIAAGVGGGLVFILSVALAVTCFRRRRRTRKEKLHDEDQKSDVSFQSAAGMNGVSRGPPLNRLYRNQTGDDIQTLRRQNSGLPMETMERTEFRSNGPRQGAMTPVHSGKMRYGEDGRIYTVLKESQIYGSQRSPAIRNHAYERFPEERALSGPPLSQSGYDRLHGYQNGRRDDVYSDIDDDFFMYQPSDVLPQTRFSGISHLNPLVSVNSSEMSGFGPHDDTPRFGDERSPVPDSDVRFSGRTSESSRREEPTKTSVMISAPTAPALPAGKSAYPPDPWDSVYPSRPREDSAYSRDSVYPSRPREDSAYSRDSVYPANPREGNSVYPARPREGDSVYPARPREMVYSRVNKGGPGQGMERGNTPLIHDYSERESGRRGHGENPGMGRAKLYDFMPEGRVGIYSACSFRDPPDLYRLH